MIDNMQRVRGLLGICQRAGMIKTGEETVEMAIKRGGAIIALIDTSMSARGKKGIKDACEYAHLRMFELPEDLLGDAIGKPGRMAACITDANMAKKLSEYLSSIDE